MMRSDAVRLMMAYINLHCCKTEDAFSGDFLMTPEEAEGLMSFIENKLGMLPPATMRYIDQPNGNTLCSETCEWEPEDA